MAAGRGRYVCSTGRGAVLCGARGGAFGVPKRKTAGLTALKRACPQCGGQTSGGRRSRGADNWGGQILGPKEPSLGYPDNLINTYKMYKI